MVAAVNSAATLIASRYEAARSSRVRAPLLIHCHIFKNARTSFKESVTPAPRENRNKKTQCMVGQPLSCVQESWSRETNQVQRRLGN